MTSSQARRPRTPKQVFRQGIGAPSMLRSTVANASHAWWLIFAAVGISTAPRTAMAQPGEAAAAEVLYQEGTTLLERGELEQACPKLAESYRLDPATGSLLALARCHEKAGKLATAWSTYLKVADRARVESDATREAAARAQAEQLRPRLPLVTLRFAPGVRELPGLSVVSDGLALSTSGLDAPIPMDPGAHVLEVGATGKVARRIDWMAREGSASGVEIPGLEDAPRTPRPAETPTAAPHRPDDEAPNLQIVGLVVGGVGVVGLGFGAAFGFAALGEASTLKDELGYDPSTSSCVTKRIADCQSSYDSAQTDGTLSTVFLIAGGALTATGVTLVVVGAQSDAESAGLALRPMPTGLRAVGAF